MIPKSPGDIVGILRTALGPAPDPRLSDVLEAFRRQWLVVGRRFPGLRDQLDDAVPDVAPEAGSPGKLDRLKDVTRLEGWARCIFVNTVLDLARRPVAGAGWRSGRRTRTPRTSCGRSRPTVRPRKHGDVDQRLRIVSRCVERFPVARLKFVDDLPDKEIASRTRLSPATGWRGS